jgi:protein O-mannosyl-transferase
MTQFVDEMKSTVETESMERTAERKSVKEADGTSGRFRHADWLMCLALLVVTFLAFRLSLTADFVMWDDEANIYRNRHIQALDGPRLRWMWTDAAYMRRYVPLTWMSWAVSYQIGQGAPEPFHAGNLLLHLINVMMVYWIVRWLMTRWAREDRSSVWLCCGLATLFWAIHPLRVEVVTWASSRGHVQCAFFGLLSLVAYLRTVGDGARLAFRNPWFWGSLVAYGAALLSYPIGIGFIVVYPVIDWLERTLSRSRRKPGQLLLEKLPFVILTAVVLAVTVWARENAHGIWSPPPSLATFGLTARMMQAFYIWACYVWRPWLQVDFSPVYTTLVDFNPFGGLFVLSTVLVTALTFLAYRVRRKFPALTALWICHLVLLIPTLGLTEHPHYPSDRYAYAQGICWSVLLAIGLMSARNKIQKGLTLTLVLAGLGYFVWRTHRQTQVWGDSVSLFNHMIKSLGHDPYRANLYVRLGSYYAKGGDVPVALENYSAALAILPKCFPAFKQRGLLRLRTDSVADAIADLQQARTLRSDAEVSHGLGIACVRIGRFDTARRFFDEAIQLDPTDASTYHDYALFLGQQSNAQEALGYVRKTLRRDPDDERAKALLGKLTAP